MNIKAKDINENTSWKDMTPGCAIYEPMTSATVNTGNWRTMKPIFIEEKCKQCLLCVPVCPDCSIPVKDGKRTDFDFFFCKGCGICYKVCPFDAIEFKKDDKQEV
jgi:pyruvate ferredoxin oxidoreductase delta subunit